ncbi:ERK1/2 activator protein [Bovine papular stomatitis virus]|uniref:ERK1/2 activator protein n=1 Tax=Bovine papular stomatitis virus TaxID=129727 RepID=A0A0E3T6H2_9POXV|nr:ERK1/2 activator protein [Bovine papular stomatitis virus]
MLLYPRKARDAAAALAKKSFCAEKLSRSQLQCLLAHGLHGELPESVYEEAVAACPLNVMYFPPHAVKLPDLITALKTVKTVPKKMTPVVILNKRQLLAARDMDVLRVLLSAGLVYEPEVVDLVEKGEVPAVLALTCAPWTACPRLRLTRTEIETVCRAIDPSNVNEMIPKLKISPQDLVALADKGNIPPLNRALCELEDACTCARLVCEWPYFNIMKFLSVDMVRSKEFARAVREGAAALCVRPVGADNLVGISKSQSRRLPEEHVDFHYDESDTTDSCSNTWSTRSTHSTRSTRSTRSGDSPDSESFEEPGPLVRRNTARACAPRASVRSSAASIRRHRGSTRISEPVISSEGRMPKVVMASASDTAEELLCHLSSEWVHGRRAKTAVLEKLLEDFRLNLAFPRLVLCSDAPNELKKKILKVICNWHTVGDPTSAATAAVEGTTDQILGLLLTDYRHVSGVMTLLSKPPLPPSCGCEFCDRQATPGRAALRSASFGTGAAASPELDDAALRTAVADMVLLALHGVVDPCFAGSAAWGPLSCALAGARLMDEARLVEALEYEKLIFANLSADGVKNTNNLLRLSRMKASDFVAEASILNTDHSRALIAVGCIAEYMLAAIFFRVVVLRRMSKIREFVAQIIAAAMDATGTVAPPIKVHDRVEKEVRDFAEVGAGVPFCTVGLVLRTVLTILEELVHHGSD